LAGGFKRGSTPALQRGVGVTLSKIDEPGEKL
jgi:hypothetical protein